MKHGKKYLDSKKLIESSKLYDPAEAISLVKQTGKAKFDEIIRADAGCTISSHCGPKTLAIFYIKK